MRFEWATATASSVASEGTMSCAPVLRLARPLAPPLPTISASARHSGAALRRAAISGDVDEGSGTRVRELRALVPLMTSTM